MKKFGILLLLMIMMFCIPMVKDMSIHANSIEDTDEVVLSDKGDDVPQSVDTKIEESSLLNNEQTNNPTVEKNDVLEKVSLYVANPSIDFAGGDGSQSQPYKITNAQQLDRLHDYVGVAYDNTFFSIENNIDVLSYINTKAEYTTEGWLPIGNGTSGATNAFYGTILGNGNTISGLWINRPSEYYIGLFGYLYQSEISNLNVVLNAAGIVGHSGVGGIAGRQTQGIIRNVTFSGDVSGSFFIGGITGDSDESLIEYATALGSVSGDRNIGGISGYFGGYTEGTMRYVRARNTLLLANDGFNAGGLVAVFDAENGIIEESYFSGSIPDPHGNHGNIGGFVGYMNNSTAKILNSYSTVSISGSYNTGGAVGYLVGGMMENIYIAGLISNSNIGNQATSISGLIGELSGATSSVITNSYFDAIATGQSFAVSEYDDTINPNEWPNASEDPATLKQVSFFSNAGWNIGNINTIWKIKDGKIYPLLNVFVFDLTFDLNGSLGETPELQFVEDGFFGEAPINPIRSGYIFKGWNTAQDGTGVTWAFTSSIMPRNDITLYAQWEKITSNTENTQNIENIDKKEGVGPKTGDMSDVIGSSQLFVLFGVMLYISKKMIKRI